MHKDRPSIKISSPEYSTLFSKGNLKGWDLRLGLIVLFTCLVGFITPLTFQYWYVERSVLQDFREELKESVQRSGKVAMALLELQAKEVRFLASEDEVKNFLITGSRDSHDHISTTTPNKFFSHSVENLLQNFLTIENWFEKVRLVSLESERVFEISRGSEALDASENHKFSVVDIDLGDDEKRLYRELSSAGELRDRVYFNIIPRTPVETERGVGYAKKPLAVFRLFVSVDNRVIGLVECFADSGEIQEIVSTRNWGTDQNRIFVFPVQINIERETMFTSTWGFQEGEEMLRRLLPQIVYQAKQSPDLKTFWVRDSSFAGKMVMMPFVEPPSYPRGLKVEEGWYSLGYLPRDQWLMHFDELRSTTLMMLSLAVILSAIISILTVFWKRHQLKSSDQLRDHEERTGLALAGTTSGLWDWDFDADQMYMSEELYHLLPQLENAQDWMDCVHPSELHDTETTLDNHFSLKTQEFEKELRLGSGDQWKWFSVKGKVIVRSINLQPLRMVGTLTDISYRRDTEERLLKAEEVSSVVLASIGSPLAVVDGNGMIIQTNEAWNQCPDVGDGQVLTTYQVGDSLVPTNLEECAQLTATRALFCESLVSVLEGSLASFRGEYSVSSEDQGEKALWYEISAYQMASIHRGMVILHSDITEKKNFEQDLMQARLAAEEANHSKGNFLATMSHEIRTPMNGVLGLTSLLEQTRLTARQRNYVQAIRNSGDSLMRILNDILDFSKIEAGKMQVAEVPTDLCTSLESSLDLFQMRASEHGLKLRYVFDFSHDSLLLVDETRLRQVVGNLISNAVKFTEHGSVTLVAQTELISPGLYDLKVKVIDTGVGISPELQEMLFRPFQQVDNSLARRRGGTGLGLAICHELAALMGGALSIESQPGEGSCFTFRCQVKEVINSTPSFELFKEKLEVAMDSSLLRGVLVTTEKDKFAEFQAHLKAEHWLVHRERTVSNALHFVSSDSEQVDFILVDEDISPRELVQTSRRFHLAAGKPYLPVLVIEKNCEGYLYREEVQAGLGRISLTYPIEKIRWMISYLSYSQSSSRVISRPETSEKLLWTQEPQKPTLTAFSSNLKILLVEDNEVNRMVTIDLLRSMGFEADVREDGLTAVTAAQDTDYDVILMDIQLPGMDGVEVTRFLKDQLGPKAPWIVAFTANAMSGDAEKYLKLGMDDYVSKPVQLQELAQALNRASEAADLRKKGQSPRKGASSEKHSQNKDEFSSKEVVSITSQVTSLQSDGSYKDKHQQDAIERRLNSLASDIGQDKVTRIINTFTNSLIEYTGQIQEAEKTKDFKKVSRIAHTIKGSSSNLGLTRLTTACQRLEVAAGVKKVSGEGVLEDEDLKKIQDMVAQIIDFSSKAKDALQRAQVSILR